MNESPAEAKTLSKKQPKTRAVTQSTPQARPYHHGNVRAAMIKAVLVLVPQKGPRGFNIQEAAKIAGVAPSALYRHFQDKEALLAAVAEEGFNLLAERIRAAFDGAVQKQISDGQMLEELALAYLHFAQQNSAHFLVMFESGIKPPDYPSLEASAQKAFDAFTLAVARSSAENSDFEVKQASLWGLIHGLSLLAIDGALERVGFQRSSEELVRQGVRALLTEKGWGS